MLGGFVRKVDDVTAYLAAQPSRLRVHHRNKLSLRAYCCCCRCILHLQQYSRRLNLFFFLYVLLTVHLSIFILVINQLDAQNLFYKKFISCFYRFRAPCAHRQEVEIVLYSLWYHHTSNSRPSCNKTDRDGRTTHNPFKTGVRPNGSYSHTE